MDNFMDKLAQKWNAAELIKANSAAEAMELKRLREQVAEYETILQEMSRLNLKNVELNESSKQLVEKGITELTAILEEKKKDSDIDVKQIISDAFHETEEFIHKENVKVYRNVQAVVVDGLQAQTDGLTKQTEELKKQSENVNKGIKGIKPLLIVIMILLLANLGIVTAWIVGIL